MCTQSQIPKDAELVQLPPSSAVLIRHILSSSEKHHMQSAKFWYFLLEKLIKLKKALMNGSKILSQISLASPYLQIILSQGIFVTDSDRSTSFTIFLTDVYFCMWRNFPFEEIFLNFLNSELFDSSSTHCSIHKAKV